MIRACGAECDTVRSSLSDESRPRGLPCASCWLKQDLLFFSFLLFIKRPCCRTCRRARASSYKAQLHGMLFIGFYLLGSLVFVRMGASFSLRDAGYSLKGAGDRRQSLLRECQANAPNSPLPPREWVTRSEGDGERQFKVMSWNVLSDALSGANPELGGFTCEKECLEWGVRKFRLLEEILRWDCDVIALQEVDHNDDWFAPRLGQAGYCCSFVKKPASPTLRYGSLEG
jgi:hypothetical protein